MSTDERQSAENGEGLPVLTNALGRAIAKAALSKHLESCGVCGDDYRCKVAGLHERALSRVFPPAKGAEPGEGRS